MIRRLFTENSCTIQIDTNEYTTTSTKVSKYVTGNNFVTELVSAGPGEINTLQINTSNI